MKRKDGVAQSGVVRASTATETNRHNNPGSMLGTSTPKEHRTATNIETDRKLLPTPTIFRLQQQKQKLQMKNIPLSRE